MDFMLDRLGTTGSKTVLNDVVIGMLGAIAVFFFLSASHDKENFDSAKQRIVLIAELNSRIHEVFGVVAASALSDDPSARVRGIDQATDRIDIMFSDFLDFREHRVRKSGKQKGYVCPQSKA